MASKRELKRNLNNMVFDIVEECYTVQLFNPAKMEKAELLIDETANFQDTILSRINAGKSKGDFFAIRQDIENAAEDFIKKLNDLN
jgi:hypothetical protein